jgi:hypothetical protein
MTIATHHSTCSNQAILHMSPWTNPTTSGIVHSSIVSLVRASFPPHSTFPSSKPKKDTLQSNVSGNLWRNLTRSRNPSCQLEVLSEVLMTQRSAQGPYKPQMELITATSRGREE